ncbi:MAG TPA: ester cyclase [Candidatus Dormibacteraeota bacterium]
MGQAENIEVARRFMETYAVGDPEGFVACLTGGWLMHEADGGASTAADLAEITRLHRMGFPEKQVEYLHELAQGDLVAQYVHFTCIHSGPYFDLEPTGKPIQLAEMIFHRMENERIAESWRLTHGGSFYEQISGRPRQTAADN